MDIFLNKTYQFQNDSDGTLTSNDFFVSFPGSPLKGVGLVSRFEIQLNMTKTKSKLAVKINSSFLKLF